MTMEGEKMKKVNKDVDGDKSKKYVD